jgi:hypothetical protein
MTRSNNSCGVRVNPTMQLRDARCANLIAVSVLSLFSIGTSLEAEVVKIPALSENPTKRPFHAAFGTV